MIPTLKAIRARFKDNAEAVAYCEAIAYEYAHLTEEYRKYRDHFLKEGIKPKEAV